MKNLANKAVSFTKLVGHLTHGAQRVATDTVVGSLAGLPRQAADLDPATLSKILGTPVTAVSVLGGDAGTSSRARLELAGDGVPRSVFVKMPAQTAATRLIGELGRLGHTEVQFYNQISSVLSGVPRCYGAAFEPWSGRYIIVLEDLAVHGCEFPDTLHPLSTAQAGLVVEQLARLHAAFWEKLPARRRRGPLSWLYTASGDATSLLTGSLMTTSIKRLADQLPVENGRFIAENYRAVAEVIDRPPHTVMHGDAHPGNVYFRDGAAGLLDWQAVRRGHPSRELAYTLITSMTPEDRRAGQRDLLDHYRWSLATAGGPELDAEELWLRFRQGALYGYVAPLITAGMGGMQTDDIAIEGLRRGVAALDDLETIAALKSSMS